MAKNPKLMRSEECPVCAEKERAGRKRHPRIWWNAPAGTHRVMVSQRTGRKWCTICGWSSSGN